MSASPSPRRLESLRLVRRERSGFDPRFVERHPALWPLARAAGAFTQRADWPEPREYAAAFGGDGPVRFEAAPPRRRRRGAEGVARDELYDAIIVRRRVVPTRARMWHDYLNALVWATFPRAKLALHTRQHSAIERWIPDGATQLPNARTRELDALALVDEGGVLVIEHGANGQHRTPVLFGHALFEGLVLGQPAMVARSLVLDGRAHGAIETRSLTSVADALLAEVLADPSRIVSPDELPRVALDERDA